MHRLYDYSALFTILLVFVMFRSAMVAQAFWDQVYVLSDLLHVPLGWADYGREQLFGR